MALKKERQKAIELRLAGMSYSQIKEKLGISKSTLSGWLAAYPLSSENMIRLRDLSQKRIESFRNTMVLKKKNRLDSVYRTVAKDIGKMSRRDMLIAGLFLYWGEGEKSGKRGVALSNTDPGMIRFFIAWLKNLEVDANRMRVTLHLYSDMDVREKMRFWSKETGLPLSQFTKPYIKKTVFSGLTYRSFGHGTCMVRFHNKNMAEYILMSLKYFQAGVIMK